MTIEELGVEAPQWLREADTSNANVALISGVVQWLGGDFLDGDFRGGDFLGGNFWGSNFWGGNFRGGNFRGGNFLGGDFLGGNFFGGNFRGGNFRGGDFLRGDFLGDFWGGTFWGEPAKAIKAWASLYRYQVAAALLPDGRRVVQMGCLLKTLEEWEAIGIRKSNLEEFPDNGSDVSEERAAAFEFAKAAALRMKL